MTHNCSLLTAHNIIGINASHSSNYSAEIWLKEDQTSLFDAKYLNNTSFPFIEWGSFILSFLILGSLLLSWNIHKYEVESSQRKEVSNNKMIMSLLGTNLNSIKHLLHLLLDFLPNDWRKQYKYKFYLPNVNRLSMLISLHALLFLPSIPMYLVMCYTIETQELYVEVDCNPFSVNGSFNDFGYCKDCEFIFKFDLDAFCEEDMSDVLVYGKFDNIEGNSSVIHNSCYINTEDFTIRISNGWGGYANSYVYNVCCVLFFCSFKQLMNITNN